MKQEMIIYLVLAVAASFILTVAILRWLIPKLKSVKLGQKILDIGPRWHKSKEGTPTMGGLAFIVAFLVVFGALILFAAFHDRIENIFKLAACVAFVLLNAVIGIIDDYTKFFKKQNQGLKASTKFLLQMLVAVAFAWAIAASNDYATVLYLPFFDREIDLGWGWYVLTVFLSVGFVNAVNLTDGIDGLASSVTFFVSCFFVLAGVLAVNYGEVIFAAVIVGGMMGFLVYNFNPARVFMGDTGSLFLGGAVVSMAYMLDNPLILLPAGFIYLLEAVSDIIQVGVYKLTKKRVFKMAPIHHHFERCGWSERKIVGVFSLVTVLFCVLAYFGL